MIGNAGVEDYLFCFGVRGVFDMLFYGLCEKGGEGSLPVMLVQIYII